jgi:hypothetical protein
MSATTCFGCGLRKPEKKREKSSLFAWKFSNGTTVYADSFDEAVNCMKSIVGSKQFWASEIVQGTWDVQLSDNVIVYEVLAECVTEAVKIARWKMHLDSSFKKINSYC